MRVDVNHLTADLIERLDRELGAAIRDVEYGQAAKATVALAFDVGLDDDAKPVVVFTHKHGGAVKGSWHPALQPRLPLDEDEETESEDGTSANGLKGTTVTLRTDEREVTMTGEQFAQAARTISERGR